MRRFIFLAVVGTALLAGFLFSILRQEDTTLSNSFIDLGIFPTTRRSAVRFSETRPLTGTLTSQTLSPGTPSLLQGAVVIPSGVRVRAAAGTIIVAEEDAHLVVEGTLDVTGTIFQSNHLHEGRRLWHGITIQNGGKATFTDSVISDASAAVTCAAGGTVTIQGGALTQSAAGLVVLPKTRTCAVDGLRITESQVGVHTLGGKPHLSNLALDRVRDGIRVFHDARPIIEHLRVERPLHAALVYAATPDLIVRGFTFPPDADRDTLLIDGADDPTHRWQGQEFPTGRVTIK